MLGDEDLDISSPSSRIRGEDCGSFSENHVLVVRVNDERTLWPLESLLSLNLDGDVFRTGWYGSADHSIFAFIALQS